MAPQVSPPRKPDPTKRQVTIYPSGVKLQVAPGEELLPWPEHLPIPMAVGVFELVAEPDGRLKPMLRLHETWVRMKNDVTERLGLGITYRSLRRLMEAGFVVSKQITPGQHAFCLQSYFQHQAKVRADPEFWSGAKLKRYMEAI